METPLDPTSNVQVVFDPVRQSTSFFQSGQNINSVDVLNALSFGLFVFVVNHHDFPSSTYLVPTGSIDRHYTDRQKELARLANEQANALRA